MVTKEKTFTEHLSEIRKTLSERKLLEDLALRAGAKSRTVHYALTVKTTSDLVGKKLKVYQEALKMVAELDELFKPFKDEQLPDKE